MTAYRKTTENLILNISVTPSASRNQFRGIMNGRLRLSLAAAPTDGKANRALKAFLAKQLGCPKSAITIMNGEKSRYKTLAIPLNYAANLEAMLAECQNH